MAVLRSIIIDNKSEHIDLFKEILATFDIQKIEVVDDSDKAIDVIKKSKPQFAILSLDTGPSDGTVVVQKIRAIPQFQYLPILMYSNSVSDDDIYLLNELGFDNILRPPFELEKVKEIIKTKINSENELSDTEKALRNVEKLLSEEKISSAIQLLTPAITNDESNFLRANTLAGQVYLAIEKVDRAKEFLARVKEKDADFPPGKYLEAMICSANDENDRAIEILQEMVEMAPNNISTLLNLGSAYISADRIEEANATLDQISTLDEDNPQLDTERGKAAFKEGDMDKAKALLSKTGQGLKLAKFFNQAAIKFVNANEIEKGISTYGQAIDIMQGSHMLYKLIYNLGLAHKKNKENQKAFDCFCESYLAEPGFENAYKQIAILYKSKSDLNLEVDPDMLQKIKSSRKKVKAPA